MALDRSDIDIIAEAFRRASDGSGGSLRAGQSGGSGGSGGGRQMSAEEVKNLAKEAASASREFTKLRAGMRLTSAKQYEYQAAQRDVNTQLNQVEDALEQYRKGKISLSKEEKKVLESKRKELSQLDDGSRANQAFQNGVMAVAGAIRNIGSTMIAGQAAVAGAIQGGASGFGIALAQLTANANTQNAITQSVAGTMTGLGGALMNFGLAGRLAGGAMMIYAQKMAVESDLKTQAQNARNQILLSGGDALLKTYMEATRAGAVITDGFDGMNESLRGSRYTMEDYTAIVKSSGEQLAATGMGVGDASLMIGRVGKVLKDTKMDRAMLALGISYQEQGQLMAQAMADMRRRDPTRELNEREVAQRTKQYAHDLAVLSDITGKDAKAKMEESRKATGQLAFQQYLAGLGKNGELVGKAMETLSPQVRQNVMDMANFGNVVNKQGAIMTAANPALDAMQRELFAAMNAGKLNNDMAVQIQAKYSKSINEGMLSNRGLALAMAAPESKLAALGEASATVRTDILAMGTAAKTVARITAEEDKSQTGKEAPQTRLMLDMTEIGQDIRKAFQEHIIKNLEAMAPLLKGVLASIGADPKLPGSPGIKGVLEKIWQAIKDLWAQSEWWEKILLGIAGLTIAIRGLMIGKSILSDVKGLLTFGKPETLASGTTPGETRTERYRRPSGSYGYRQVPVGNVPGGNLPGGSVPGGGTSGELGKFGAGIKSILTGLGQGAGGLIEGVLKGIAAGIGAFGNPKILIGAGILAGSIVVIGGAVAAATWLMGKALPTFAEGLKAFDGIDGNALVQVGKGAGALGLGLAAFGAGSGLASAGSIISNVADGFIKFFGGKTTLDQFREMAELAPKLKSGAEGITTFSKSMGELLLLDIKKIDALANSMEKLQSATSGPGFFNSMGNAALGTVTQIDAIKNAINRGANINQGQGGAMGSGQTAYLQGAAVVHLSQQTVNALKGIGSAVVTTPAVPNQRPATMSTSKPEATASGGLTQASLNNLAKNDPVLFALTQLLETERAKDRATDGQTSKIDIAIKLMDRMAEQMAKQAGSAAEYAQWARKNVLIKK
jgi:hypothetical protein